MHNLIIRLQMRPSDLLDALMTNGVKANGTVYTIPTTYSAEIVEPSTELVDQVYEWTNIVTVDRDSNMFDIAYACRDQGTVLYIDTVDIGQYQTPLKLAATQQRRTNWGRPMDYRTEEPDFVRFKNIPIVSNYELQFIPPRTVDYLAVNTSVKLLAQQHHKYGVLNIASTYDIVVAGQRLASYLSSSIETNTGVVRCYIRPL